jgi:uncharacterized membrane protein
MLHIIVKWVHILAAMAAVGANLTYQVWISAASREPESLPFILRNISLIDRRLANPCYGLILLTGLIMALTVPIPLTTPWLLTGILLYAAAALLGIFAYAPLAKDQRRILKAEGFDSPAYKAVARRSTALGFIVTADVVVITFLMVAKPSLWG